MSHINRRRLLQYGAASGILGALTSKLNAAVPASSSEKLLVIFARGGNDALNSFIPRGDPSYDLMRKVGSGAGSGKSNVHISQEESRPISGSQYSTTYVEAHPALKKVTSMINANGGRAAILGRVGNPFCKRSHFTEMAIIETGKPDTPAMLLQEGWGAKLASLSSGSGIRGISHAAKTQRIMLSTDSTILIPTIERAYNAAGAFDFDITNLFGASPGQIAALEGNMTRGWLGNVNQAPPVTWSAAQSLGQASRRNFFRARDELGALTGFTHVPSLFPNTQAERATHAPQLANNLPQGLKFLSQVEEAMFLLGNTGACISTVDFGGFDTHNNQLVRQNDLLEYVDQALYGADQVAQEDTSNNYLILFITEFGRTIRSNGADGTDHGDGTAWIAVGDGVNAGVYNMGDPSTPPSGYGANWVPLSTAPNNAIPVGTDFRSVLCEILQKKFSLSNWSIDNEVLRHSYTWTLTSQFVQNQMLGYLV